MKLFTLLATFVFSLCSVFSQQIVISEYHDIQASANGEWTELLVTADGTNLAGWILRDNNSTDYRRWYGGIRFLDVSLWQNLKRGTIIVIQHREASGYPYDLDPTDGYIEIAATNTAFFERYTPDPDPDTTRPWEDKALSIAEACDILELINASGKHMHSLSHNADRVGGIWRELSEPKPNYTGTLAPRHSIAIAPGADINAYLGTGGNTPIRTFDQNALTLGLPNATENSLFWRKLREPNWSSPSLSINVQADGNHLSWKASTDVNTSFCGYMIIRYKKSEVAAVQVPQDGLIYNAGDVLGAATVINNVPNATAYIDRSDLPCGETYEYRVYAYRFNSGNYELETIEANARGRQYNQTNFATAEFDKVAPKHPTLTVTPSTTICAGETVTLTAHVTGETYTYSWLLNNRTITGATEKTYTLDKSGTYNVVIHDEATNCNVISDPVKITVIDYPTIKMTLDGVEIKNDTTVIICKGDGKILKGIGNSTKFEWYSNGDLSNTGKEKFVISKSGEYYLSAINENLCRSNSPKVTLVVTEPKYEITPSTLTFELSSTESSTTKTIQIKNTGEFDLVFTSITNSDNFEVISPEAPYIIPAGATAEYTIRFLPQTSGDFAETISFLPECSNDAFELALTGHKDASILSTNRSIINFTNIVYCEENLNREETITLENIGTDPITIYKPSIEAPFSVDDSDLPVTINNGELRAITIRFNNTDAGTYHQDMYIPYSIGQGTMDSLLVSLNGTISEPKLEFPQTKFKITSFSVDVNTQNLEITVNNTGDTDITIEKPNDLDGLTFANLPLTIPAGKSETIQLTISIGTNTEKAFAFTLNATPCDINTEISINCSSNGYNLSSNNINLGYVVNCPTGGATANYEVVLRSFGTTSEAASISEIKQGEHFTFDIHDGATISDTLLLPINFSANEAGTYNETISFTLLPSQQVFTINLSCEVIDPKLTFFSEFYMPDAELGTSSTKGLRIQNKTQVEVTLVSITEVYPPFSLDETQTYPQTLPTNGEWAANFIYTPTTEGSHRSTAKLTFKAGDCTFDSTITIEGSTGETSDIPLALTFNAPNKVNVGTTVNIPVQMEIDTTGGNVSYVVARITHVEFDLEYNESVVTPIGIIQGQSISASNYKVEKISPNLSHCSFDIAEPESMSDGVFFNIRSRILWGNDNKFTYILKNVTYTANSTILTEGDSATIEVIGDCAFDTGLIEVGGSASLSVIPQNDEIKINYILAVEDRSTLKIINSAGETVFLKDVSGKRGSYSVTEKIPAAGAYIAILRSGNFPQIVKFIIK